MLVREIIDTIENGGLDTADLRAIRLAAQKAEKAQQPTRQITQREADPWAFVIADSLQLAVAQRYPHIAKQPIAEQKKTVQRWALDIEAIHRIDKQPIELVTALAKYSQQDSFWRQQVRSGANLRKHFAQLYVKAKEQYERQQKGQVHSV